jgi:hypothetical protein
MLGKAQVPANNKNTKNLAFFEEFVTKGIDEIIKVGISLG